MDTELTEGEHTLAVGLREAGARLDKINITTTFTDPPALALKESISVGPIRLLQRMFPPVNPSPGIIWGRTIPIRPKVEN